MDPKQIRIIAACESFGMIGTYTIYGGFRKSEGLLFLLLGWDKDMDFFPLSASLFLRFPVSSLSPDARLLFPIPAFGFELPQPCVLKHSCFIIRDVGGVIWACPRQDVPTVFQSTKSRDKAVHLLPQGKLCTLCMSAPLAYW
jgi:hypothetical protein